MDQMETVMVYFETIPPLHRSLILVGGLSFFWVLEGSFSLFNFQYKKWSHALTNIFFTGTSILINFFLAFLLLKISDWVVGRSFGILHWLPNFPLWIDVIIGMLLLDFIGAYLPHWTEHRIKPLWMIHLVHHSDHHVDTTTANRHHPLESLVRFSFTLFGVFIIGANMGIVMLYQSLSLILTQFNHANIKLPKKFDLYLSYILVSPDMHKTHHHYRLPYTDANFGNIFSIWDRVLGTYLPFDREKLIYGVDVFFDKKANSKISHLLKQPFQTYSKPTMAPETDA
jgi:sterol desaturase/sphingolipid hydroxylase (fatty acid hydroxylase superfamily)